jgi:hypothetical protein
MQLPYQPASAFAISPNAKKRRAKHVEYVNHNHYQTSNCAFFLSDFTRLCNASTMRSHAKNLAS